MFLFQKNWHTKKYIDKINRITPHCLPLNVVMHRNKERENSKGVRDQMTSGRNVKCLF